MRAIILGVKIELATFALVVIVLAGLGLAGCASPSDPSAQADVRQEHLQACNAYTSALERVVVWKDLGKFNDKQLAALRTAEAATTPLCMTAEPSASGTALVHAATDSLEALLLQFVIEENS
jgi:hypothetical protein